MNGEGLQSIEEGVTYRNMIKKILQIESVIFFLISLYLFNLREQSWLIFILLLFTPDISMIGYLKNKKIGAIVYNVGHNYLLAISMVILGNLTPYDWMITLGIILFAHVSLDRALGFGLKYPKDFKETHIQKV